ncbi:hypothetical protein N0V95_005500 [Ascochyta clinopodiicola]|nr:hypothetical protein N0V95_005500 [Ascochyta clinopodiicola]
MAAPGARMRLTVVVEALAEENAHGEYRDEALEVFKERKFAMPVQLHDTFETVWTDIEQRYKTNYLDARQAATFSIKKLQDAYECDLDMTDTVGAIFEGEPDRRMHLIRVIPHFVYRETSVVPGSMLRPSGAQKRHGDDLDHGDDIDVSQAAHKRRRVEAQHRQRQQNADTFDARRPSPNRPILSTESHPAGADSTGSEEDRGGAESLGGGESADGAEGAEDTDGAEEAVPQQRSARSKSGLSLVELSRTETGQTPFTAAAIKQESSPEPVQLPAQSPAANGTESVERPVDPASDKPLQIEQSRAVEDGARHVQTASETAQASPQLAASPKPDSQEAAIHESPLSSVEAEPMPVPPARKRRDIYQVPSSPEFMQAKATPVKPPKTYGRSPRSAAVIQREVDLLNMARQMPRNGEEVDTHQSETPTSTLKKARAFQRSEPDEIESTPQEEMRSVSHGKTHATSNVNENGDKTENTDQDHDDDDDADLTASFLDEAARDQTNGTQTPARKTLTKAAKPGSLKKPSRASLVPTPASTKRGKHLEAAGTPTTRASAVKRAAKAKPSTPASTKSTKSKPALSQETTSRMEHLQKLLNASQNTPKRRGNAGSPARSGSTQSRERSNISSPEVRTSTAKRPEPVAPSPPVLNARPVIQMSTTQQTPIKSPVPLPSSVKTSTPIRSTPTSSTAPKRTAEASKRGATDVFRKPAVKKHESPVPLLPVKEASNPPVTVTPRRSEVPLPVNVRILRRSSSLQGSPLANGHTETDKSSPVAPAKTPAKFNQDVSHAAVKPTGVSVTESAEQSSTAKPGNGAIVISSAEPSSTEYSDSGNERQDDVPRRGVNGSVEGTAASNKHHDPTQPDHTTTTPPADISGEAEGVQKTKPTGTLNSTPTILPQTQDKPPSGQDTSQAAPWVAESWGFGSLGPTHDSSYKAEPAHQSEPQVAAPAASIPDDEGFAEQELYSTAIEDNASRSRSTSAAVSTRSSPAVSRRPARFLSHSPTPDASDSEEESDEASAAPSRAASPQANGKDESESESSSDSSEDDDVEMPDLPAGSTINSNNNHAPPSSPPLHSVLDSTPVVPETSQTPPSQNNFPTRPVLDSLPAQQSSQAPRSSQSVSIQAADRRRYTGFRSLREQLADTKAAQAATQVKKFDPRTMSLGKLVKNKALIGLGVDDNESSDEDSSSSNSDSE